MFRDHGVYILGSFIFGLPSDRPHTFEATAKLAQASGLTFAQFVLLTPFPGTLDFEKWAARGWYDYGVSASLGWLTEEGKAKAETLRAPAAAP